MAVACMMSDSTNADAVYVRGLCLYYGDNLEKGLTHFQRVLTLDPEHKNAKVMRIKAKNLKEKRENGRPNDVCCTSATFCFNEISHIFFIIFP